LQQAGVAAVADKAIDCSKLVLLLLLTKL